MSAVPTNVVALNVVQIPTVTPAQLAEQLFAAKAAEKAAKQAVAEAEGALIAALSFSKTEGQSTETLGDFKVTLKAALNTKVDWDALDKILPSIPENLRPVKTKRELDGPGVKYLAENHPDLYKKVCKALTTEPAKTSVTVVRTA